MNKKFIELDNGEKLAFYTAGKGKKTLLLIHGNMSDSSCWLPLIEKIKNKYTIYAVDLRGFGDSSYNNEFNSLNELSLDIKKFCEKLGLNDIYVAGWSAGGGVAMSLAANTKGLVKKLFLLSPVSVVGYQVFGKFGKLSTKEELKSIFNYQPIIEAIQNKDDKKLKLLVSASLYRFDSLPTLDELNNNINSIYKERCLLDMEWALMNYNITDSATIYSQGTADIKKINAPIHYIYGMFDKVVLPFMTAESIYSFIKLRKKISIYAIDGPHCLFYGKSLDKLITYFD